MTFESSRNIYSIIILWAVVLLPLPFLFAVDVTPWQIFYPTVLVFLALDVYILWILFDTKYEIRGQELYYCSGPIRGIIPIANIRKLESNDTFFKNSVTKTSLGMKGFVVYYNKFDDIFISPADKEGFVKQLLLVNPTIELTEQL